MRWRLAALGALGTLALLAIAGWGAGGLAMPGPRPGHRMGALVPQLEITAVLVVALPLWTRALAAERAPALRRALAATARGHRLAVGRAAGAGLAGVLTAGAGGAAVWLLATLVEGGPALHELARVRLVVLAVSVFALGLGIWASAAWPSPGAALAGVAVIVFGMAAAPFAIAPVIGLAGAHPALVQAGVVLNPWIVTAGASGFDLLRAQWVYALSPLGSLEVVYPGPAPAIALYTLAGAVFLMRAVAALRRRRA